MRFYSWGIIGIVMVALAGAAFWQVFGNHAHAGNLSRLEWSYGVEWAEAKPELEWTVDEPKAVEPPKPQPTPYELANAASARDKTPLVTWVNVPERKLPGVATVYHGGEFDGSDMPRIIYSKGGFYVHTFSATTRDPFILDFIIGRRSAPAADPFRLMPPKVEDANPPEAERKIADGDSKAAGQWPKEVAFLADMEQYESAKLVQVSFNRSGQGMNTVMDRRTQLAKWNVPGHFLGLTGWANQLYRKKGNPVKYWFGHVDPNDSPAMGVWGSEITHQRQYGSGAKFADVIRTSKGIVEVRVAEMVDGEWRRSVPYSNPDAAPAGYVRPTFKQCASCHDGSITVNLDAPGSGVYGAARIPGGGGVYSEKFPAIEQ